MSHDQRNGLQKLYSGARQGGYGFLASNVTHFDVLVGLLQGSARVDSDLVVQLSREEAAYFGAGEPIAGLRVFDACCSALAKRFDIGVFCNINHVDSLDESEFLDACLTSAIPASVMIDASAEPFDRNVELAARTVKRANDDLLVEAELGRITGVEGNYRNR